MDRPMEQSDHVPQRIQGRLPGQPGADLELLLEYVDQVGDHITVAAKVAQPKIRPDVACRYARKPRHDCGHSLFDVPTAQQGNPFQLVA